MALEFVNALDKINRGISILIYADPGAGKTTLATTLPEGETLIINTEAGLGPTLGTKHVIFNLKEDLTQLEELYKYIRTGDHPFKYVVVDNISELEQWMVRVLVEGRGKDLPEIKEHGDVVFKMKEYMHNFRDLVYSGINVVFNAWEMNLDIKSSQGEVVTKAFPKLYKRLAPDVCGLVDVVGHLEMYQKTGDRYIRFEPTPDIIAKSQFKGLEKFEPADLQAVFAKLRAFDYMEGKETPEPKKSKIGASKAQ
jgi:phage nucleotide-binding protein